VRRRTIGGVLPVLLALAVGACTPRPADLPADVPTPPSGTAAVASSSGAADSVALERTRCYGTCPAYRVVLDAAGRVAFASRNPDDSTRAIDRVPPVTLATLLARAESVGFFALPARIEGDPRLCARRATDGPSSTLVVYRGAGAASVADYRGCHAAEGDSASASRLERLRGLQGAVDSAVGSARWVRPAGRK
jgi:hypothetical protein